MQLQLQSSRAGFGMRIETASGRVLYKLQMTLGASSYLGCFRDSALVSELNVYNTKQRNQTRG